MNNIDTWSLVTGAVSIISFLFAMWDKFPKLKNYLIIIGTAMAGFVLGRMSPIINEITQPMLSDTYDASVIVLILALFLITVSYMFFMIRKNEIGYAYIGVVIILLIALPNVLESYTNAVNKISPSDYLILAKSYEQNGNVDDSIKYLTKYKNTLKDPSDKEKVQKKIDLLKEANINAIFDQSKE